MRAGEKLINLSFLAQGKAKDLLLNSYAGTAIFPGEQLDIQIHGKEVQVQIIQEQLSIEANSEYTHEIDNTAIAIDVVVEVER